MYTSVHIRVWANVKHVCMCRYVYACACVYNMWTYVYACMCVHACMYVCMHVRIQLTSVWLLFWFFVGNFSTTCPLLHITTHQSWLTVYVVHDRAKNCHSFIHYIMLLSHPFSYYSHSAGQPLDFLFHPNNENIMLLKANGIHETDTKYY